jgi:hypothetical protein
MVRKYSSSLHTRAPLFCTHAAKFPFIWSNSCRAGHRLLSNIWTTRASVSPGYPNTRKQCMKIRARSASVFIHCFRVFGYPGGGETRARVVYMASQMNRDVTECFRLLIWIECLTKHNVIRNSIQVILHAQLRYLMKTLVTFIKFHRVIQMASCDQIGDYH